jgi:autotransporter strand-loop-strand O-heptosyltransferase
MKNYFFCARNFKDYMKFSDSERAEIQATEISTRNILDSAEAQKCLYEHMRFYEDRKVGCEAPIIGETGIDGFHMDFNFGLRLEIPSGNFHIRISDFDSGMIFFDEDLSDAKLISVEKYFIRWQVELFRDGEKIFWHVLDLERQPVMIIVRLNGLGDVISFLPFMREFKNRHRCKLTVLLPKFIRELAAHLYPDIPQVEEISFENYANYFPVMPIGDYPKVPADVRNEPMEHIHALILGLNTVPVKSIFKPTVPPVTNEPYVCIGVQASLPRKSWLYPGGWDIVVNYLKSLGWRVFCIDKKSIETSDGMTICKPDGAEDFTGDIPIMERANMLYHAEFFIGPGSGLAWVANAVDCPVVMICGFSQDWFEFYTPYRVANRLACNGCFNDIRVNFLEDICPYHKGTARELECQKKIYPRQVINAIERLIIDKNLIPPVMNLGEFS